MPEVGSMSVTGSLKTELFCKQKQKQKPTKKTNRNKDNFHKISVSKFKSYKPYYSLHTFPPFPCSISVCFFKVYFILYVQVFCTPMFVHHGHA